MGAGEVGRQARSVCASEAGRALSECRPTVPYGASPPRVTASHRRGHPAGSRAATLRVLRWSRTHRCGWLAPMQPGLAFASARQAAITADLPGASVSARSLRATGEGGAAVAPATSWPAQMAIRAGNSAVAQPRDSTSSFRSGAGPRSGTAISSSAFGGRGNPNFIELRDEDVTQGRPSAARRQ